MPTGYTADLMEKGQTFQQFALGCARAFGALIEMRDLPHDAPIPEAIPLDLSYYDKGIATDTDNLRSLLDLSPGCRTAWGAANKEHQITAQLAHIAKYEAENARLNAMLEEVKAYQPPTPDHAEFKSFMLQQLTISLNHVEYSYDTLDALKAKPADQFYADAVASLQQSIAYKRQHREEEIARNRDRNRWLSTLRRSLALANTQVL